MISTTTQGYLLDTPDEIRVEMASHVNEHSENDYILDSRIPSDLNKTLFGMK